MKGEAERAAGEEAIARGVRFLPTPGHTPGHLAVEVGDGLPPPFPGLGGVVRDGEGFSWRMLA
jgi:hypothetical protein